MTRPSIFVAIPSYRDPECQWTVRDLFAKAAGPGAVSVGICSQAIPGADDHCFLAPTRPAQVRMKVVDARRSKGMCWARVIAHSLWRGEDYVLQIDSHMRFHPGWDDRLLAMIAQCASDKPVLSTYPATYVPPRRMRCYTPRIRSNGIDHRGIPKLTAAEASSPPPHAPEPARFLAGGFMFARAALFREVPYDPQLYQAGEELCFSARAWTRGWDFFAPHECVVHHYYDRLAAAQPDDDCPDCERLEALGTKRALHLLGLRRCADPGVVRGLGGRFGLGSARSLARYADLTGLPFGAALRGRRVRSVAS